MLTLSGSAGHLRDRVIVARVASHADGRACVLVPGVVFNARIGCQDRRGGAKFERQRRSASRPSPPRQHHDRESVRGTKNYCVAFLRWRYVVRAGPAAPGRNRPSFWTWGTRALGSLRYSTSMSSKVMPSTACPGIGKTLHRASLARTACKLGPDALRPACSTVWQAWHCWLNNRSPAVEYQLADAYAARHGQNNRHGRCDESHDAVPTL